MIAHQCSRAIAAVVLLCTVSPIAEADDLCTTTASYEVDETYQKLAESTGGEVIRTTPGEKSDYDMIKVDTFLERDGRSELDPVSVLRVSRKYASAVHSESVPLPVDSSARKLLVRFTSSRPSTMRLIAPDGKPVAASSSVVEIEKYSGGCAVMLSSVDPGGWRIEFDGEGTIGVHAEVLATRYFQMFEPVEREESDTHRGWYERKKPVLAGQPTHARARVDGGLSGEARFEIRSGEGKTLLQFGFDKAWPEPGDITESYVAPAEFARAYLIGTDRKGFPVQRMLQYSVEGAAFAEDDPNGADDFGVTTLMRACQDNDIEKVKQLLAAGAPVNAKAENGTTALMMAAEYPDNAVLNALLAAGADVNVKTIYNGTAIFRAVVKENVEAVRILLEHGADPNVPDGGGGTPLRWARIIVKANEKVGPPKRGQGVNSNPAAMYAIVALLESHHAISADPIRDR